MVAFSCASLVLSCLFYLSTSHCFALNTRYHQGFPRAPTDTSRGTEHLTTTARLHSSVDLTASSPIDPLVLTRASPDSLTTHWLPSTRVGSPQNSPYQSPSLHRARVYLADSKSRVSVIPYVRSIARRKSNKQETIVIPTDIPKGKPSSAVWRLVTLLLVLPHLLLGRWLSRSACPSILHAHGPRTSLRSAVTTLQFGPSHVGYRRRRDSTTHGCGCMMAAALRYSPLSPNPGRL